MDIEGMESEQQTQLLPFHVPKKMIVSLKGEVKSLHKVQEGTYILAPEPVNGKPCWIQENGKNAIWRFNDKKVEGWANGLKKHSGSSMYMLFKLFTTDDLPYETEKWRYLKNGKWIEAPKDVHGIGAVVVKSGNQVLNK